MRSLRFAISVAWAAVVFPQAAHAVDGLIEINQACVNTTGACGTDPGCFPGDQACFPVTITQPGSYILTSNLTVPNTNTGAIELQTEATIDLNGFRISGPGTCSGCPVTSCTGGTGRGIYNVSGTGVAVRNGTIAGMGDSGIEITGSVLAEKVVVALNGGAGIRTLSGAGKFVDVAAATNGGDGLAVDGLFPATVRNATVSCNGDEGIEGGAASTIVDSNLLTNAGAGIHARTGSKVTGNAVLASGGFGIDCAGFLVGYAGNVLTGNVGGSVSAGCAQFGVNLCNGSTTCP